MTGAVLARQFVLSLALVLASASAAGSLGCGGPGPSGDARSATPRLELSLISDEGRTLNLSALRGRPVLLFMFATYDASSQLALAGLLRKLEGDTRITPIGVAVQPDARAFLAPFRAALELPFPIYIDATNALLTGESALGKLPGVPAFVAVDPRGQVRRTLFGVATKDQLEELIESAL